MSKSRTTINYDMSPTESKQWEADVEGTLKKMKPYAIAFARKQGAVEGDKVAIIRADGTDTNMELTV